jgi:acyl-CoA reductase-like NAD-dependent aldehyde dehydrogenase
VQEGARIVAQAPLSTSPKLAGGFFVRPTLFADVHRDMRIAREEIFGPVVCAIPFGTEAEAISIANDTNFGLVGAVFTADSERQIRVGRAISAGIIFINNYSRNFMGSPFGGTKHSGYGREHAIDTLKEFAYTKTLRLPSGVGTIPRWAGVADVF